ncbi:MAG TPA: hypothetical protein DDW52_04615 [Planctomycetaceae bacterium]|nr:hypothetical protein [Planctomycetaceae bacterium]
MAKSMAQQNLVIIPPEPGGANLSKWQYIVKRFSYLAIASLMLFVRVFEFVEAVPRTHGRIAECSRGQHA